MHMPRYEDGAALESRREQAHDSLSVFVNLATQLACPARITSNKTISSAGLNADGLKYTVLTDMAATRFKIALHDTRNSREAMATLHGTREPGRLSNDNVQRDAECAACQYHVHARVALTYGYKPNLITLPWPSLSSLPVHGYTCQPALMPPRFVCFTDSDRPVRSSS